MLFNSTAFLLFFPIVLIIYYVLPQKVRQYWLLGASYYFYMNWNAVYGLLLFSVTALSYFGAKGLSIYRNNIGVKRLLFVGTLSINIGLLIFFKYIDFIVLNINRILDFIPGDVTLNLKYNVILPVGISFYVLQSTGYLIDVYRGTISDEKNFGKYALFISFFPQLVAGPIERSGNLLHQLDKPQRLSWPNCKRGIYLILWGYFTKLVIADRVAIFVDAVYENPQMYQGVFIIIATVLFAIQIYCDFYGYSTIAKGVAICFGIRLMDNFDAPYLAQSVSEFWRRWHISLTGWFRDYLYIPLGGNRKGEIRKQMNRFFVFGVSGLWHGASFAFIAWGILNAVFQTLADLKNTLWAGLTEKFPQIEVPKNTFSRRLLKRLITFVLICITWIFFRAGEMSEALIIIRHASCFDWTVLFDGRLYELGIAKENFQVVILSIVALFVVDNCKYQKRDVICMIENQEWWFQMGIMLILCFVILLFGCYGVQYDANQFIYFQF